MIRIKDLTSMRTRLERDFVMLSSHSENKLSQFFSQFIANLNQGGITYCILRNYQTLPQTIENDIDIWVKNGHQNNFRQQLYESAEKIGWDIIAYSSRLSHNGEGDYFLIKAGGGGPLDVVHIDCWTFLYWKGVTYVDEYIFPDYLIHDERGFYTASVGIEASILLLKDLLYHGKVRGKYKKRIIDFANKDCDVFLEVLKRPFGEKTSKFILDAAKVGNWENLEKNTNFLRWILFKRALIHKPVIQIKHWTTYLCGQMKKFLFPRRGLFIVLIGPDGSGKSTTANSLIESEVKRLFQKKIYFHGHFPILPGLKKIALLVGLPGPKKSPDSIEICVEELKPFGYLRSMIYPLYYGLNYILGHYLVWKERARGGLVIFDRYFYDYFIQKNFAKCPRPLLYTIAKLIPNPDLNIYLKNNPEEIFRRKPELHKEEIERQSEACEEIVKKFKNGFIIETSCSPEKVVEKIQRIIVEKLRERQNIKDHENPSRHTVL